MTLNRHSGTMSAQTDLKPSAPSERSSDVVFNLLRAGFVVFLAATLYLLYTDRTLLWLRILSFIFGASGIGALGHGLWSLAMGRRSEYWFPVEGVVVTSPTIKAHWK